MLRDNFDRILQFFEYKVFNTCTKSKFNSSITSWENVSKNKSCELVPCTLMWEAPVSLPPLPPTLEEGLEAGRSKLLSCLVGVPTIRFDTPIAPFGDGLDVPIPLATWFIWRPRSVYSALPRPVLSNGDNVFNSYNARNCILLSFLRWRFCEMILIFIAVNEQVTFYEAVIRIHLWPLYIMASHLCFHFFVCFTLL